MMIKNASRPALAGAAMLLAAMFAGCATVEYSSPGKLSGITVKGVDSAESGQVVSITTTGYYMFWTIPLASGNLDWNYEKNDVEGGFSLFSDQVSFNDLQDTLLKIANVRDCDLADVSFCDSDETYAGLFSETGLIGTCFGSSQMSVSAVLVPRKNAKK